MKLLPSREASKALGLHANTLRKYADEGKINYIRNEAGQRRYDVDGYIGVNKNSEIVCYCRVSSYKQKDDLERQVTYMLSKYPNAEIIKDIGSGINYKRKGLNKILARLMSGEKLTLVVAYKDRLARFGTELIQFLVNTNGGKLVVLNEVKHSPEEELTSDLLNILHVFSCRMHGLRKYSSKIKKDTDISKQ